MEPNTVSPLVENTSKKDFRIIFILLSSFLICSYIFQTLGPSGEFGRLSVSSMWMNAFTGLFVLSGLVIAIMLVVHLLTLHRRKPWFVLIPFIGFIPMCIILSELASFMGSRGFRVSVELFGTLPYALYLLIITATLSSLLYFEITKKLWVYIFIISIIVAVVGVLNLSNRFNTSLTKEHTAYCSRLAETILRGEGATMKMNMLDGYEFKTYEDTYYYNKYHLYPLSIVEGQFNSLKEEGNNALQETRTAGCDMNIDPNHTAEEKNIVEAAIVRGKITP
jgi:hypothetical protein